MNLEELWKNALGEIELQISRPNFATWMRSSLMIEKNETEGTAVIGLPNNFAKEWVENKYNKLVLKAIRDVDKTTKRVIYVVYDQKKLPQPIIKTADVKVPLSQLELPDLRIDPTTNLNPKYTFPSFSVGKSNEMAHAACAAVVESVGTKYNPLFIHGGVGVGKTHLVQAVGNEIRKLYQDKKKIKYLPSEKFINEIVTGIRSKTNDNSFKEKYRNFDVLIMDDIQHIAGKQQTQLEFFHTFNALYENGKQIILSSDRPPAFIEGLEDRLKSRFSGGMIVSVDPPEYELRVAVIKNKLDEKQINLNESVIDFIATKVYRNFRELEGVLNRVVFWQQSKNQEMTPKIAEQIINETIQEPSYNLNPNQVIKCVSDHYSIKIEDLIGRSRKKELVEPRQIAMYLLRDILGLSFPYIGEKMGKRDHTTVIYACEKIGKEVNKNHGLNRKLILIKDLISKS